MTIFQTHTQAKRKILESKRELLLKEMSRANSLEVAVLKDRLVKLESEKARPYGTLQAVSSLFSTRQSVILNF
jgi:solute carrier family 25 (peroxisomal adenine nucleotide transporter), member 17